MDVFFRNHLWNFYRTSMFNILTMNVNIPREQWLIYMHAKFGKMILKKIEQTDI